MKMKIKSKLAFRCVYIALSAIIIFSLLIFYLPTTAKAVNLSLGGVRSGVYQGSTESWVAQFDFNPGTHPSIQGAGGDYDFLPSWSDFRIVVYDSSGAQVAFANFGWYGEILSASSHFLLTQNMQDGKYYFIPNPPASTEVGYGYGFYEYFYSGIGYGWGFQPGDIPYPGYGFFAHDWPTIEGYGPMYDYQSVDGLGLFEFPGPRYQINFWTGSLHAGEYKVRLIVNTPDTGDEEKCFLSDYYNFTLAVKPESGSWSPGAGAPPPGNVEDLGDNVTIKHKKVGIDIGAGTTCTTADGKPLKNITIDEVSDPPAPPEGSNFIGLNYDLGPAGAQFDPAIGITFLPDEIPPGAVTIAYYDPDTGWVELATENIVFNPDGTITAYVTHFTYFSVLLRQAPASFTASGLSITPAEVDIAESVTISAKVTNTGDLAGKYDLILKINGVEVSHEMISLDGDSSQTVTFVTIQGKAGTYTVSLNGLSGKFTVRPVTEQVIIKAPPIPPLKVEYPKPTPPAPAPTPTPPPGYGPTSWWVILIIAVAAVVVIGGSLWLLVFRRGA